MLPFRPYKPADLDAMVALDELCFELPFRFSRGAMRRFAERKEAQTYLAHAGTALAGFCILHIERGEVNVGYIVTIDIAPECRRQGIGLALMEAAIRDATAAGCAALLLHVFSGNMGAATFYRLVGFTMTSRVEDFYGEGIDALTMQMDL
jgi:ribosomal-protein-alanine N-acetyltransferase